MPVQTSVAIPGDKNIIEKALDSIKQFFKK